MENQISDEKEVGQIIEVEYNSTMVEADLKAQEENDNIMLEQDTFNDDSVEELLGEGATINENTEIN